MVFESVVVDVLNRFLGDYVVNLDSSQLSLGIWGGKPARCQIQITSVLFHLCVCVCVFCTLCLIFQTADQNWTPCLLDEKAKLFFKSTIPQDYHFSEFQLYFIHNVYVSMKCKPALFLCAFALVFRPISANAKLRMNPRSDVDFSSPKVDLVVNLPEVAVELSRPQYVSILELLGSVDMMTRNLPYRKYRPDVAVHTNAHQWRYVITGILEVNVKPRLYMWSWQRIRHHRQHVKKYREIYKNKITSKKPAESLLKELEVDLLCFCSYLSGFDELMTPAEKAKLYAAIGYSDTAVNPNLPKNVSDKQSSHMISAQLSSFEVSGLPRGRSAPILLSPRHVAGMKDTALLDLMFETNPLDASADQRLRIESQALEIIYDAMTVNSMSAFFMPPKDLQLDELTNATLMKLEQFRDKTSTGLMYIIETQKVLDLKINLMASYVIVPENGFYDPKHNLAILDLGHFQLSVGSSTLEDIMSRAYDSFDVQLSSLQFLYTKAGGDWKRARPLRQSAFHILEPVDLKVVFSRAMVVTDSRMPKFKIYGELPLLSLRISDDKVRGVLALLSSIPLPESRPVPQTRAPQATPKVIIRILMGVSSQTNIDMIVADKNAPDFKTMYKNTEQLIKVNFSSLDVHLHTEALLNSINFLNNLLPPLKKEAQEEQPVLPKEEEEEEEEAKIEDSAVTKKSCKKVHFVCFFCFAVSIADKEVFDFRMVNHVDATEGDAYTDMHIVDTSVTLTVGCIQVIFLNKFMSSILAFINNFQEAKNALAEVTAQAAEKAATGVLELAERSTRISLDVDIKAPVVFLPQSSVSHNVIVADLGLVTVKNHFEMVSSPAHTKIPPVMDIMAVGLSDLKMYRTTFTDGQFKSELQLLKPVNMDLSIKRNLSASWYHSIPDIQINAHLKPMSVSAYIWDITANINVHLFQLILSQEDLTIVLKTLSENLSENSDAPPAPSSPDKGDTVSTKDSQSSGVVEGPKTGKLKNTLKLDFKFDSMTLVLYSPNNNEIQLSDFRDESLKLAEFMLGTISTAVHMFSDSSMKASLKLTNCLLDDKRQRVKMITSRMMAMRQGREGNVMVDMSYRQGRDGTVLDTLVQDLYLCASMEFLLTVADVFLKAMADGFSGSPKNKQPASSSKDPAVPAAPVVAKTEMNIVVKNPEIVFVADLTRAEAPALVMTTQCELVMKNEPSGQSMTAAISDLKVVACPLLREKREHNVTTVLQPCQVFFQSSQSPSQPQSIELSISSLTLKVSPIILNTVITIQSALSPAAETPEELESPVPQDLWERRNLRDLKLWFLEEEEENVTRSVIPLVPHGESLKMNIHTICLTLEAGVGHRTVPMLLAKASFQGNVKNWSTLINLHCHLDLEVNYYNEMMGLWEPLLEPLDNEEKDGFRPWTLAMKKKPVSHSGVSDEVDGSVPDYKTVISFTSKDQLNVTLSKCGLHMLSNLGTAFAEATKQTAESFQKDQAPFVVKNRLGLPVAVLHSEVFRPIGKESKNRVVELQDGESLNMDYTHTAESSDQFSAMTSLSAKNYIQPTELSLQPVTEGEEQYDHSEGFTYNEVNQKPGECLEKTCHHQGDSAQMLKINMVPLPDTVMSHSPEEEFDKPIILHLWPTVLLRNLLPYPITFKIKVQDTLQSLSTASDMLWLWSFIIIMEIFNLSVSLLGYLQQDWEAKYSLCSDCDEISFIRFLSLGEGEETETRPELNIAVHVKKEEGQLVVAIHSPYWMVNKTGRLLQYKADDIHRKHPKDYDMPLLFSFKPRNFLQNNKIRLMISESELSDDFSIDTVGSYGDVKCKGEQKDYMVTRVNVSLSLYEETESFWYTLSQHSDRQRDAEMDELAPGQAVYYTWAEPTGSRILSWKCGKYKGELKSEEGKFFVVSFYEGLQRVALFTTEQCVFKKICDNEKIELAEQETCISLQNMGVSLVNNTTSQEVAFIGITRYCWVSRWHTSDTKKVLMFSCKGASDAKFTFTWCLHMNVLFAANGVDLRIMQPFDAPLRRNFLPALKVEYSVSARQKTYRVQINRIQIQNQLPGAIFPFVFYPIKPPKSVSMDSEPKPLADVSIITRAAGHSDILRIKYFKVLIQEMDLRVDLGFLYAILELFTAEHASAVTSEQEYLKTELNHSSATDTSPISLYEYFHISPIKLHLSFSLSTGGEDGNKKERETEIIPVQSLNLLLKSIGATLTDAQDVLFKLAFCELTYQFRTTQQLQSEVIRHYSKQAIKQMYVLVLGLDVLGNPFGLIRGLSEGVEAFFYEPYQGAIQGPEEFIEGMALGVKALVGGAVGGLAGAASRITGAMAKGVAAMTMDEEYQQKRREAMNKQPSGLREGLTRGGKGLVSGFVSGITGIVTKPIKGAQKEGAAGFFKGVGKGLVGALTRPTGGIIDMASSTFQGIKRSEYVSSLRPPRFIHEDGVIRPYKEREGIGSQMLQVTHDTSLPAVTPLVFKIMVLKMF
uniref:Vacuolar protein sorting 13 homolog A n=1 Tax=Sinocyclocheilus grahami TaxID=75366 RepID=A0A672P4J4_SINGR